jgi:hypothetical protein
MPGQRARRLIAWPIAGHRPGRRRQRRRSGVTVLWALARHFGKRGRCVGSLDQARRSVADRVTVRACQAFDDGHGLTAIRLRAAGVRQTAVSLVGWRLIGRGTSVQGSSTCSCNGQELDAALAAADVTAVLAQPSG